MRPPSVDALARTLTPSGLPHPLLVDLAREAIAAGAPESAASSAAELHRSLLQPVVNATGVLLHTNLGRSPLDTSASHWRYANVELDLASGRRGSRRAHAGALLARAIGAEAALVVNNGAAAILLALAAVARGRPVVVSRGELVEIGGGFRVPDVMAESGARLVEVGTTNKTRVEDYRAAIVADPDTAAVLKVHASNYRMVGFTGAVAVGELARLGVPVIADLGSGLLDAATPWLVDGPPDWLRDEPAARQTLESGADLITFSGDKLLGGPQAGLIAGRADLVDACASHPLARALRPGGLVLAALQDTALAYLDRRVEGIPFWRMASEPVERLRERAGAICAGRAGVQIVDTVAMAGGGAAPGMEIPSVGMAVDGDHADALRALVPPVVARVTQGRTLLDVRTVDPGDDAHLAAALQVIA